MNGLIVPPLIHSGVGKCKGCDPCGQLLCKMLQAASAVHTLHTHSMAAQGCSTGDVGQSLQHAKMVYAKDIVHIHMQMKAANIYMAYIYMY